MNHKDPPMCASRAMPTRVLIGLTGNIATGKSEVARLLADLGAHTIDADKVAHEVMQPGGAAYNTVLETFGQDILAADGTIDRAKLGAIVFRDPDALRKRRAVSVTVFLMNDPRPPMVDGSEGNLS